MRKKLSAFLMIAFMVQAFAGCSTKGEDISEFTKDIEQYQQVENTKSDTSEVVTDEIDLSEHVVVNYLTCGTKPTNGKTEEMLVKLNAILTEKVNAEIQIKYISWDDYLATYNLTMSQKDGSIDMAITGTDWLDAWPNSQKGNFLKLSDEMLKTYAPNTYASVPPEHWDACRYNGDICFMPEDQYSQWTNHGFIYRNDWSTEAGLNGVHSWNDLETYFTYVKDTYQDVIPWFRDATGSNYTQVTEGWFQSYTNNVKIDGFPVPLFYGESKNNPYKIMSPYLEGDVLLNYATKMKEWKDKGFFKNSTNAIEVSPDGGYLNGKISAYQHHTVSWYTYIRPAMKNIVPTADTQFFYFGEETQNLTRLSISHGAMAISAGSKHPERTLMVYDLLRNDKEIYHLFNYGIEGVQYIVNEKGEIQTPEGYDGERDAISTNYWGGRNDALEINNSAHDNVAKAEISKIYDKIAIQYPYSIIVFDTTNVKTELFNVVALYNEYIPNIFAGNVVNPQAYVTEFQTKLKDAGIQKVIDELQKQMDAVAQ